MSLFFVFLRKRGCIDKILYTLIFLSLVWLTSCSDDSRSMLLVTTTSTENTGLIDALVYRFEEETDYMVKVVAVGTGSHSLNDLSGALMNAATAKFAQTDDFDGTAAAAAGNTIGSVVGQSSWGLENDTGIPEIDIKVDSVSVTAVTPGSTP